MGIPGRIDRWVYGLQLCLWSAAPPALAQPPALGGQFQVNSYTPGAQIQPSVGQAADGAFVVTWMSLGSSDTDVSGYGIQVRRYDASSDPFGAEFQANTLTSYDQRFPKVAVDTSGAFVVVWDSDRAGESYIDNSVQARRWAANGTPLTAQFRVNSYTSGNQDSPGLASDGSGNFVVVWQSVGSSGDDNSLSSAQGQRYPSNGPPLGGEFQIDTVTTDNQLRPAVARNSAGAFVVVWESDSTAGDDSDRSIQGQRFAADGTPQGAQFQVNSSTPGVQESPAVAIAADGGFVVVWADTPPFAPGGFFTDIRARRFAAGGTPVGSDFRVNAYIPDYQVAPAVALDDDGSFVVAWSSEGGGGADLIGYSIQAQRFAASSAPLGGQFQVNVYATGDQKRPAIAATHGGGLIVAWDSDGSAGPDSSGPSIQARRYAPWIFGDSFESSDTSSWSGVLP